MYQDLIVDGFIHNQCPVDLHELVPVRVHTIEEVNSQVISARKAQSNWDAIGFESRAGLLKQAGKRLLERRQEVLELIHDEAGKTPGELLMSEAVGPLQYIQDWIRVARPWLKPRRLSISPLAFPRKSGVIEMLPRGVVAIIAPWNYPLANFFKPVFAALLCGNSVVLKPSEYSPRTAAWFVKVMGEFLPPHVLTLVQGDRRVGQALVQSGVDAVTFTGSFASGKEVAALAAERMIPCSVELGGKDAAIVLNDCDLDRTVAGVMHWALHNSGQACGDIERVYVEAGIADVFVSKLVQAVSALRVHSGDPQTSDLGPTVHLSQLRVIEEHVRDAIAQGAKLRCGGKRTGKGLWFEPTVLDHCRPEMKVIQEPTFGPIIPIIRVKDSEEAVRLANACDYGLNGSIWSQDLQSATQLARRLEVGTAFINNHAFTGAIPAAPWTGVKKTGSGIANSTFGLQHYTRPRTLVIDRKKSADGWWLPMDRVAEELGHRLAQAQLGSVFGALKIPFLMAQRQATVMAFVRDPSTIQPERQTSASSHFLVGSGRRVFAILARIAQKAMPPLTRIELTWGYLAMEAMFTGEGPQHFKPLSRESCQKFLIDMVQTTPFPGGFTLRLTFWIFGLAPIFQLKKFKTFDRLSIRDRLSVIQKMDQSNFYLVRQFVLLLKTGGAFSQVSTTRFHFILNGDKKMDRVARGISSHESSYGSIPKLPEKSWAERDRPEMEI